ncbi:thioredoxin family protein [Gorillibacterium timonense]|uniref:thioredoxin family protein n=1 Tax=Gorillibacterium timonense TaxID=1689269 RepID=UPI00071DD8D8|nr:thioredoxin family protein [Gorillibacterium timonense]
MNVPTVNQEGFEQIVNSGETALIEFGASWCAPCRALGPILDEMSAEYGASLPIAKVDVDDSPELASTYGVMSMPTVILFYKGSPVDKLVGLRSKAVYQAAVERSCKVS